MSQSEVIVGALLAAFVLYLLMTNRLAAYWALLTGGGTSAATGGPVAAAASLSPAVTPTVAPPSGTSTANAATFVPNSVQQIGNTWIWTDITTGATRISPTPPQGYVAPAPATPTTGG